MLITIDGTEYTLPASFADVTIQQRIDFDKQYGQELNKKFEEVYQMEQSPEKGFLILAHQGETACKTLSFYGGMSYDVVCNTDFEQVMNLYVIYLEPMSAEFNFTNEDWQLQTSFEWQGETWVIAEPELDHQSKITFGEFVDSKQIGENLKGERWEELLQLCCIYFRKKDERYRKEFAYEGGERYRLMQSLPLEYALHVGFFLSCLISTCTLTSHCLKQEERPNPS